MSAKKKIWITAGGTGSGWRISKTVKQYFADSAELYISDINPKELVAAATLADVFVQVPPVNTPGYAEYMYRLLQEHGIDAIIPLIPWEQTFFAPDRAEFAALRITSASPCMQTEAMLNDKWHLYEFCREHQIPAVPVCRPDQEKLSLAAADRYVLKQRDGFGSIGLKHLNGQELAVLLPTLSSETSVLQPDLTGRGDLPGEVQEVTVEGFSDGKNVRSIVRQRLESKSGVCTKACFPVLPVLQERVEQFAALCPFPPAFNIQFVKCDGEWLVMDVNLRIAAGGGLSEAAGFQLSRALVAYLLGVPVEEEWLQPDPEVKHVLRVYQEVVVR
ncbi:MAG: hypothetical protein IJ600_02270 [Lachnospiraceae bacterium]|nr:hypothetical protein [Lachnospiraceae bacterium]